MSCGSYHNTMSVGKPCGGGMSGGSCNSNTTLSAQDPLDAHLLGARPNRAKVRDQIREYILHMLGAPAMELELDEQNIDFCVDQALMIFEDYAPPEYFTYYSFDTIPGKSVYKLRPDVGHVLQVYYNEHPRPGIYANEIGGSLPIEFMYPGTSMAGGFGGFQPNFPMWGDAGTFAAYTAYGSMFTKLASAIGSWEWVDDYHTIKLYPTPFRSINVSVHYLQKNKDWPRVTQAMQEGALSYAKEILGRIRSKYSTIPGPGGGLQLDGATLLAEAQRDREKWFHDLIWKFSPPQGEIQFM